MPGFSSGQSFRNNLGEAHAVGARKQQRNCERGQVAQVVERSPEKAGVGGSTPSLATIISITYKQSCGRHLASKGKSL